MDPLTPPVGRVLAWDVRGPGLPDLDQRQRIVELLATYGRVVADDLRTQCLNVSANSDAGVAAQAALGEASRRLYLPPPHPTQQAMALRAQNLARLTRTLTHAAGEVAKERERARKPVPGKERGPVGLAAPP